MSETSLCFSIIWKQGVVEALQCEVSATRDMGTETGEYRCEEAGNQPEIRKNRRNRKRVRVRGSKKKPEIQAPKNLKVRLELFLCIFDAY